MKNIAYRAACSALPAILLSGCLNKALKPDVPEPRSRDEAAAVLMSVTSVAAWNQVADAVQPNFTLTGDAALQQVAPTTLRIQEQVLNAFGATLGLGLPQRFSQGSSAGTQASSEGSATAGGSTTTTVTTTSTQNTTHTDTRAPGVAPVAPTGTPAGALALTPPSVSGNIDIDPILKYQAALALYQAVQLMNRQVQNAASIGCFSPYLVQLKIAVLPYRKDLPYDLHTRISFFDEGGSSDHPEKAAMAPVQTQTMPAPRQSVPPAQAATARKCDNGRLLPHVVPLLVTDDIERAIKSSAVETAQQIGLALSAMYQGIGLSAGGNRLQQSLDALSGQDINSRFTVARLTDNTVYVRIGGTSAGNGGSALVGQTYDVSLLVLVPLGYFKTGQPAPNIRVTTHNELRSARTGAILPGRSQATLVAMADAAMADVLPPKLLAAWNALDAAEKSNLSRLLSCPIQVSRQDDLRDCGDYGDFDDFLRKIEIPVAKGSQDKVSFALMPGSLRRTFWTRFSILTADSSFKTMFVPLPAAAAELPAQPVLLLDDTKDTTQAQIRQVSGVSSRTIAASLNLKTKAGVVPLAPQAVAFDSGTGVLTLTFPSLAKWSLAEFDVDASELVVERRECPDPSACPGYERIPGPFKPLLYRKAQDAPEAGFDLSAKESGIVTIAGKGALTVTVGKLTDDEVTLSGDNVVIAAAADGAGAALPVANGQVKLTKGMKNTTVALQLQNVYSGMMVAITGEGKKGDKKTGKKSVKVIALAR